ncbi:MAG: SH3 domain-containing protein [Polyangiaceae bacterium]|nr:SH3 domain-containing protein [Polyangiaceae bacterium]MCW5791139.1 SH3 domain-containing protein [Polyangiaceae bacterium]
MKRLPPSSWRRGARSLLQRAAFLAALLASPAAAAESESDAPDADAFARVVVAEAEVRSGPGITHRVIHRAERGEAFLITGREGQGFWLEIALEDGRTGYVLGDVVEPVAIGEDEVERPGTPGFFAPPALQRARGGFALMAGVFDKNGYSELRPALVLAPAIALEGYVGMHLNTEGKGVIYGAGGTLNLAPDWPVTPFLHLGGGGYTTFPNADAFVLKDETVMHARAGGGFLISLRWRLLIRLEATQAALFTADSYRNTYGVFGGLGSYF